MRRKKPTHTSKSKWYTPSTGTSSWGYNDWGSKSVSLFQDEMTGSTSIFGRDKDVEITFSGEKAFADGKVINFPALDPTLKLNNDTLQTFRGWVDHEAAKIRYSDIELAKKYKADHAEKEPLLHDLFTAVEACRVESLYNNQYTGAKKNLNTMASKVVEKFMGAVEKVEDLAAAGQGPDITLNEIAPMAIATAARKQMHYYSTDYNRLLSRLSNAEADMVDDWADQIFEVEDTKGSYELAKKIYEELIQFQNEDEEKENPPPSPIPMPDINGVMEEIAKETKIKYEDGKFPYKIWTTKYDRVHHWSDPTPTNEQLRIAHRADDHYAGHYMRNNGNIAAYKAMVDNMSSNINHARRKIELMIAAQRRIDWDYQKEMGKLDSRRLSAAYKAAPDVFKVKQNAPDLDTAISIMVDLSGSMRHESGGKTRRQVACETTAMFFEIFTKIGIPFEIIGFTTTFSAGSHEEINKYSSTMDMNVHKYARIEAQHLYVFKSFKDRPFDARPYMMGIGNYKLAGHNNADGEALAAVHDRLLKRPEKRKILFAISDGQPHCQPYTNDQQYDKLKEVVKDIEKTDTHLVAVGICTSDVKKFYTNYIICNDAKDLTGDMLNLLEDILLPGVKKAA